MSELVFDATAYPAPVLDSNPTAPHLPEQMTEARRWLLWKSVPNNDPSKKPRKMAFYVNGNPRGKTDTPDDYARLATYEEARAALARGGFAGLGFALGPDGTGNHWQGVDFDDIPTRPHLQALRELVPGVVEVSPSGAGLHFIGYGRDFDTLGNNGSGIEAYAKGRFFTVTGQVVGGTLSDLSQFIVGTLKPEHGRHAPAKPRLQPNTQARQERARDFTAGLSDDRLIDDLRGALDYLNADDYEEWINVGQALKTLGESGRALWLDWSQGSGRFDAVEAEGKWQGFDPTRTSYKAVFSKAQAQGWINPAKRQSRPSHYGGAATTFPELPDDGEAWPDPEPLPDALPPVAPFDEELLPQALRGWVSDIAHRMQCPADFPAVGALVAISSLVGARAVVRPKERDDWAVVPNLWGLVVGRPGVKKSPTLSQAMAPLQRLEAAEREAWQSAHEAWELDCKVAELAAKANEKKAASVAAKDPAQARALLQPAEAPAEPRARRYVVNDATVEKLADLLTVNPWGLLVYRDELHGLLCSMDRQGQEGARGFYLTGYDGNQGYAVDRILRGESYVPRVCLAMLGGIQPGKVQSYVREAVAGGASDDGLLQRFGLAVWPDIAREFHRVDQWPDTQAKQAAWAVFERLDQLQPASETEPQEWRFTPEAQSLYWEWVEPFETEIRGDELHPALVSHLSKYSKLVPALALIFALVDTHDSGGVIHERELLRALAWVDYLRTHAERLYSAAVIPETAGAQALLTKIKGGKLHDRDGVLLDAFTPRQVSGKHWAGLDTPDAVRKAADLLADYGWLVREVARPGAAGGRPSDRYLIHPMLKAGA